MNRRKIGAAIVAALFGVFDLRRSKGQDGPLFLNDAHVTKMAGFSVSLNKMNADEIYYLSVTYNDETVELTPEEVMGALRELKGKP